MNVEGKCEKEGDAAMKTPFNKGNNEVATYFRIN